MPSSPDGIRPPVSPCFASPAWARAPIPVGQSDARAWATGDRHRPIVEQLGDGERRHHFGHRRSAADRPAPRDRAGAPNDRADARRVCRRRVRRHVRRAPRHRHGRRRSEASASSFLRRSPGRPRRTSSSTAASSADISASPDRPCRCPSASGASRTHGRCSSSASPTAVPQPRRRPRRRRADRARRPSVDSPDDLLDLLSVDCRRQAGHGPRAARRDARRPRHHGRRTPGATDARPDRRLGGRAQRLRARLHGSIEDGRGVRHACGRAGVSRGGEAILLAANEPMRGRSERP